MADHELMRLIPHHASLGKVRVDAAMAAEKRSLHVTC
jgi:hypothetical protein